MSLRLSDRLDESIIAPMESSPSTPWQDQPTVSLGRKEPYPRFHAAMIWQSSGPANALRALLKAEQERGPDFVRLANALSALYPKDSEEKRLLDAMLLAVPR